MKLNVATITASSLLLLVPVAKGWNFEVFDADCVTSTDAFMGTTDQECEDTPNPHECFRISNMGTCELYLHATADDCEDGESEQFYDAGNQDEDISPDFSWDSWSVIC